MRSSTEGTGAGAQHMPAWKRLGLKLKQPTAASEPANGGTPAVGQPGGAQQASQSMKRKLVGPSASLDIKRSRREAQNKDRNAPFTPKPKSVSFADTPTENGKAHGAIGDSNKPLQDKARQQHKKTKGPEKKKKPEAPTDLKPALEYLRLWETSRDSWKFNKNHQSALIKHIFDADGIPTADIDTLYDYIRDLKGFVRMRLRETAMETRNKDVSDRSAAFPAGTTHLDDKQVSYERLLTDLLHTRSPSRKRKSFDEADFVASSQDVDVIIRRVVKRMRAELVIEELSDGEQTDDSRTTQSSGTVATSDTNPGLAPSGDKRVKLNDGIPKRRRKLRVNVDDSSSSESESDGESDTSSDSSSDESDEADEANAQSAEGYESSSSESSSSSSSAGELNSDDDDSSDEHDED